MGTAESEYSFDFPTDSVVTFLEMSFEVTGLSEHFKLFFF